jgi:hypothetical protein
MRNLWLYYLIILVPFILLVIAARFNLIGSDWFVALLFLYVLYRQFVDAQRLMTIGVIRKISWKIILNPFLQTKYFKELYWVRK